MPYRIAKGPKGRPDGIVSRSWWPLWPRVYRCGHRDAWKFAVRVRGAIVAPQPADNERCADCVIAWLIPRIIDCPLCARPIFPGDPVWMHARSGISVSLDDAHAGRFFSCLRMGCAVCPTEESTWTWDGEMLLPPATAHP